MEYENIYVGNNVLVLVKTNFEKNIFEVIVYDLTINNGTTDLGVGSIIVIQPTIDIRSAKSYHIDDNYLIITLFDRNTQNQGESEIIVVDLHNKTYQEYNGMDIPSSPNGIIDNIIYLSFNKENNLILLGLDLNTNEEIIYFNLDPQYNVNRNYGNIVRTVRGDAIMVTGEDRITRIINIYNSQIIMEINQPIEVSYLDINGVYYFSDRLYFNDFNGTIKEIALHDLNVVYGNPSIIHVNDGIWILYRESYNKYSYVKYINSEELYYVPNNK